MSDVKLYTFAGAAGCYVYEGDYKKLKGENESLRKDAERYRWLRAQHWNSSVMSVVFDPKHSVKLGGDCPSDLRLDVAVDFARNDSPENPS